MLLTRPARPTSTSRKQARKEKETWRSPQHRKDWRVALLHDSVFWGSLRVTVYFVVLSVGIGILISLITAVILQRLTKSTVIRGLVILPFLISSVVAALVWQLMLDPERNDR